MSTKTDSLEQAKEVADDWYLGLKVKSKSGEIKDGKTFRVAADAFRREYQVITQGQRSPKWVQHQEDKIDLYLLPYFGDMILSEITPGIVQEYRIHRAQNGYRDQAPARKTIENEMIALRQVLKTAHRHGWLQFVPDFSPPYKTSGKITHRAWFSPQEYRQLYQATRHRTKNPKNKKWQWQCEQLHDYVLFMANTGIRPDEAARLEYRDVKIVKDWDSGQTILEIEVRGKRGIGYCKSTSGAIGPFIRLRKRNHPQPMDRIFPKTHRALFNSILDELKLKTDRDGNRRTAYSLRHSYICFRLMEGADIYQIAKNCRTSVEMIEKHYAAHIKNTLNAAAINVRRPRPPKKGDDPQV